MPIMLRSSKKAKQIAEQFFGPLQMKPKKLKGLKKEVPQTAEQIMQQPPQDRFAGKY